MTPTVSASAESMAKLATIYRQAPQQFEELVTAAVYEAALFSEAQIKENAPRGASHVLGASFFSNVTALGAGDVLGVVSTPILYAEAVEIGTKPHMPPIAPIEEWVAEVIAPPEEDGVDVVNKIATLVALKIKKHGTEGQFFVRNASVAAEPIMQRAIDRAIVNLSKFVSDS